MKQLQFCVTARNRLTGQRDVITPPLSKAKALEAKLKLGVSRSSDRPYTHPKVDIYPPPERINAKV